MHSDATKNINKVDNSQGGGYDLLLFMCEAHSYAKHGAAKMFGGMFHHRTSKQYFKHTRCHSYLN